MGAWGVGIYDNDDAADWVGDLTVSGIEAIGRALTLPPESDYLEAHHGACALAAADVVARLGGSEGEVSAYCEDVVAWVAANRATSPDLVARARAAIDRVQGPNSELHELWAEDPTAQDAWIASLAELRHRLDVGA